MTDTGSSRTKTEAARPRAWLMTLALVGSASAVAFAGGCGGEAPGVDVERSAFANLNFGYATWSQQARAGADADLGPDTDRTCFISGVGGNLNPHMVGTSIALGAIARVYRNNGRWFLTAHDATDAEKVTSKAVCVPSTSGRTATKGWYTGQPKQTLAPYSPSRLCSFTYIGTNVVPGFGASNDSVVIDHDSTNWYLSGTATAEAEASCVDVSGVVNTNVEDGTSIDVASDLFAGQSSACLLTEVRGSFRVNDWSNGTFVTYSPSLGDWIGSASKGKRAKTICVQ